MLRVCFIPIDDSLQHQPAVWSLGEHPHLSSSSRQAQLSHSAVVQEGAILEPELGENHSFQPFRTLPTKTWGTQNYGPLPPVSSGYLGVGISSSMTKAVELKLLHNIKTG